MPFNDLREFIDAARKLDQVKDIHGAHWNLEIGALTEIFAFKEPSPLVVFDQIPDHGPNFRVASNLITNPVRSGLTVGMAADARPIELVARWKELLKSVKPIPPRTVPSGPVLENVRTGADIDMTIFPAPQWHELDGGRYIGTADCVITAEPEEGGWVNVGIYRVQVHDQNTLGLYVSPGHHARIMREKYWEKGKSCPVVVTFGQDPLLFLVAGQSIPYGMSELDYAGGLRGAPVDVVRGDVSGLPIPATAEIAIEGEVPPPKEQVQMEGPFGEWPGYYAHGAANEPVIRVKKLYYRNDPILAGAPPMKPPFITFGIPIGAAAIWNYLDKADVPDIKGVWCYVGGSADVTPHSLDIWNVGLVEVIPDCRGAYGNAERNKGRLHRRRAGENRIIAIIEFLDANDRFVGCAVSIVARPLAEGPFRLNLLARRRNFTFDGDFRGGGNRQSGHVAADDIDQRSPQSTNIIQLR